jgi:hypothetical protein
MRWEVNFPNFPNFPNFRGIWQRANGVAVREDMTGRREGHDGH